MISAISLLSLDPITETMTDSNLYGFRPLRAPADAIEQCFIALAKKASPQWVLEGDIRACFKATDLSDGTMAEFAAAHDVSSRSLGKTLMRLNVLRLTGLDWFISRCLLEPIGHIPPIEYEIMYYQQTESAKAAWLKQNSLR